MPENLPENLEEVQRDDIQTAIQTEEPAQKTDQSLLNWKAHEFVHYEKGSSWYFTFGILFLFLIAYEIYLHDYFAALTFFIFGVVIFYFARQVPDEVDVMITDHGIQLDDFKIPYTNIKRFWIVNHAEAKALHLETTAYLNRYVVIQLNEQDPEMVRRLLKRFIPESDENEETLTHRIARKLKF